MHCPGDPLCSECLADLERLRPIAHTTGEQLAELLASHVVPDVAWAPSLDEHSESILKRVRPLTPDARLVRELAVICHRAARARWEVMREARSAK